MRSQRDRGASSVEYALVAVLIAGATIAVLLLLGPDVLGLFNQAEDGLNGDQA